MSNYLIVVLFSIGSVALFVVGMSLTLMIKGHNIDSEISTNKNMQDMGIRCAVQESRTDEQGVNCDNVGVGCHGSCSACEIDMKS